MPKPDLTAIRNEAIRLAEQYAAMEVRARDVCESVHVLTQQLKACAPMSDLERALVEVVRRRPLPVHFEALRAVARMLADEADRQLAAELAQTSAPEPDLPPADTRVEVAHA